MQRAAARNAFNYRTMLSARQGTGRQVDRRRQRLRHSSQAIMRSCAEPRHTHAGHGAHLFVPSPSASGDVEGEESEQAILTDAAAAALTPSRRPCQLPTGHHLRSGQDECFRSQPDSG